MNNGVKMTSMYWRGDNSFSDKIMVLLLMKKWASNCTIGSKAHESKSSSSKFANTVSPSQGKYMPYFFVYFIIGRYNSLKPFSFQTSNFIRTCFPSIQGDCQVATYCTTALSISFSSFFVGTWESSLLFDVFRYGEMNLILKFDTL